MWRSQTRFLPQMAYLGCTVFAVLVLLAASVAVARTWKSSSGSYQVEADLVKSENGKVTLRKPGGQTIIVDESRLSDDDRAYLQSSEAEDQEKKSAADAESSPRKKPRTFSSLMAQANECHSADEVLALYKEFLADSSIDENELLSARNNLPIWEARVAKKMVRFGTRWLEPELVPKFKEKAAGLVEEAIQLVENKQIDKARNKLSEASREDPESLQANFLSGLICVFCRRDLPSAKQEFYECVKRQPNHLPALNNLALVEVRLQRYGDAIAHWKTAMDTAPASLEIYQNIGRLRELSKTRACPVPPFALQRLGELHGRFSAEDAFDPHVGWLYMPFDPDKGSNPWIVPDKEIGGSTDGGHKSRIGEDRTCMRCSGTGKVKCPNKQCTGGTVPAGKKMSVAGANPATGRTYGLMTPVFANCTVCKGLGKVACPDCVNGIEKSLAGGSTQTVTNTAKRSTKPQRKAADRAPRN
ncbi:MAG: SHD1 domain-containing protein [Thermoguttaceae bacterium]